MLFFSDTIWDLPPGTKYFIRSYLETPSEITYSSEKTFTSTLDKFDIVCNSLTLIDETTVNLTFSIFAGSLIIPEYGYTIYDENDEGYEVSYFHLKRDTVINAVVSNLTKGKKYYFKAFAKPTDTNIKYSNEKSITIPKLIIKTLSYSKTSITTATLSGEVDQLGFYQISDYGFCWSVTTSNPDFNSNIISKGTISTPAYFYADFNNIVLAQTYYFRAYAVENNAVYYGETLSFTLN